MTPTRTALAREAWRHFFDFLLATRAHRDAILAHQGLTPNDSKALFGLAPGEGRTMRALAESWGCDASNATWMVDRLEEKGLAVRRPDPEDRRVKRVVLTPKGRRVRDGLLREIYEPPPELLALNESTLAAVVAGVRRLPKGKEGSPHLGG